MKIGDEDGSGVIYDENGTLILHEGERILVRESGIVPDLKTTWGIFGGDSLIEKNPGTGYLTDERFVFIAHQEDTMSTVGGSTVTFSLK